ncbi:hypothetical protein FO488_10730 [Geobacter sp. FeAm09]|uniref:hypothetical protein n=1 Tax=Geobacter sp. FeAm09 TaxID=2597769 RepID=UPI0011ECCF54|nr:hypothetical protein [Geobacter sp. FeAm09]QEM68598.1 hypothetical protein FO488_10730 [Geobacter sp. FeAm09]
MGTRFSLFALMFTVVTSMASIAYGGSYLTSESFAVSAGGNHAGTSTTCMVMNGGSTWSGGASGLQGSDGTNMSCGNSLAANVALKFNVGATVAALNAAYGVGGWTIENPKLTFQYTLYANNTRFNGGAGDFNIYWVGNDGWSYNSNPPVYASSPTTAFSSWAGSYALLTASAANYPWTTSSYTGDASDCAQSVWTTDKTGNKQAVVTYDLDAASGFVGDITGATNGGDYNNVSLYLMPVNPAASYLGLTIFTGGGTTLPTLSFDVVSVP